IAFRTEATLALFRRAPRAPSSWRGGSATADGSLRSSAYPEKRLVGLDDALELGREPAGRPRVAGPVDHEPRSLILHLEHPVNLVGAHALLGRSQQVQREQPFGERHMAVLERGALGDRELALAGAAAPQALTRRRAGVPLHAVVVVEPH